MYQGDGQTLISKLLKFNGRTILFSSSNNGTYFIHHVSTTPVKDSSVHTGKKRPNSVHGSALWVAVVDRPNALLELNLA